MTEHNPTTDEQSAIYFPDPQHDENRRTLTDALDKHGVRRDYDRARQIIHWLVTWEPDVADTIADWIEYAHRAGYKAGTDDALRAVQQAFEDDLKQRRASRDGGAL